MTELTRSIAAVNCLNEPSAAKHVLLVLLGRQAAGELEWPGIEGLAIDTSIPRKLIEISVSNLRQKGLLKLVREPGSTKHQFRVPRQLLQDAAFSEE